MGRRRHDPREIALGHGHWMRYFRWAPDNLAANRKTYGTPLPRVEKAGAIIRHRKANGRFCESAIHFDVPEMRRGWPDGTFWQVQQWAPLTLTPSLLCRICGDHGFITDGKWVPA